MTTMEYNIIRDLLKNKAGTSLLRVQDAIEIVDEVYRDFGKTLSTWQKMGFKEDESLKRSCDAA